MTTDDLGEMLDAVDDELATALCDALESDPESLRAYLAETDFLCDTDHEEPELTDAEAALLEVLENVGNPKSTGELQEIIEIEFAEKLDEFSSLQHRSWISDKLNSLTKKGCIGKYRDGREVKYTVEPTEAVRRWALHNNKFASELTRSDAEEIATDTGMRQSAVRDAISRVKNK